MRSTIVSWPTTCAHRSRTRRCSTLQGLISADDFAAIAQGLSEIGRAHASGKWQRAARARGRADGAGESAGRAHRRSRQARASRPLAQRSGADGAAPVLERCGRRAARPASLRSLPRSTSLSAREGDIKLPGYTHMQQAMPSSVALWAGGFAAELRDDAEGLRQVPATPRQESARLRRGLRRRRTCRSIASGRARRSASRTCSSP